MKAIKTINDILAPGARSRAAHQYSAAQALDAGALEHVRGGANSGDEGYQRIVDSHKEIDAAKKEMRTGILNLEFGTTINGIEHLIDANHKYNGAIADFNRDQEELEARRDLFDAIDGQLEYGENQSENPNKSEGEPAESDSDDQSHEPNMTSNDGSHVYVPPPDFGTGPHYRGY